MPGISGEICHGTVPISKHGLPAILPHSGRGMRPRSPDGITDSLDCSYLHSQHYRHQTPPNKSHLFLTYIHNLTSWNLSSLAYDICFYTLKKRKRIHLRILCASEIPAYCFRFYKNTLWMFLALKIGIVAF